MTRRRLVGEPVVVGRERELRALDHALEQARAGHWTAVAVVGQPGIGKTTVLERLGARAASLGFAVFAGRGSELEQAVPFGLVIDALDEPLGRMRSEVVKWIGEEARAEIGALLPAFAVPARDRRGALDVERYRSHEAVRTLLEHVGHDRPVLLALDDVHWADPASVELISHLLRRQMRRSILALAYRDRSAPSRLLGALDAVARDDAVRILELAPFTVEEAAELLGEGVAQPTVRALHAETGGNPFYLEELARVERTAPRGALPDELTARGERDVPSAVRTALAREFRALTPSSLLLLEAASVVGDPFDLDLAAEIALMDESAALAALDELAAADVVRATDVPRRLRFRHPIVRRSVYDGAQLGWRLDAHRRAAQALATRGAPIGAQAHHLERSAKVGDMKAAQILADAGYTAAPRAPAAASRWFGAALRLMGDTAPAEQRRPLLLARAAALATTGRLRESAAMLSGVLALVPSTDPGTRARVTAMIARTEQGQGHGARARRLVEEALAGVDPATVDAGVLWLELSENHFMMGEWDAARVQAEAVHGLARSLGDRALELAAIAQIGWSACGSGAVSAAREGSAQAARGIDQLADEELTPQLLEALLRLGYTEIVINRLGDATRHLERGERACRATGHGHLLAGMLAGQAGARLLQGRLAQAREAVEAAADASLLLENDQSLAMAQALRCWIAVLQGDGDTALAAAEVAIQAAERAPRSVFAWLPYLCHGEALIELGRPEQGRAAILAAGGTMLTGVIPPSRPHWWRLLIECDLKAGRIEAAERLTGHLEQAAASFDLDSHLAEARLARAQLHLAREDWKNAVGLAREAAERYQRAEWRIEAARANMVAARALEQLGDAAGCEHELVTAHTLLRTSGASRLADRVARRLRELGKPVTQRSRSSSAAPSAAKVLTPRELEVADRVSRGYTNRQIAEQLFISEKTVEKHLARVFVKLGVTSRAAVAATIVRESEAHYQ